MIYNQSLKLKWLWKDQNIYCAIAFKKGEKNKKKTFRLKLHRILFKLQFILMVLILYLLELLRLCYLFINNLCYLFINNLQPSVNWTALIY